jgi:hypothetical protein
MNHLPRALLNSQVLRALSWSAQIEREKNKSSLQSTWTLASNHTVRCDTELGCLCRLLYASKGDRPFGESYSPSGTERLLKIHKSEAVSTVAKLRESW